MCIVNHHRPKDATYNIYNSRKDSAYFHLIFYITEDWVTCLEIKLDL